MQTAHYIKDSGLGYGSICEVRTARGDTRNVGRTAGQILTLTLPTAGLTKLHSHNTVHNDMNGVNTVHVWESMRSGDTSSGLHHREIFEMLSLSGACITAGNHSVGKKNFEGVV